jgi:hypothetical protein
VNQPFWYLRLRSSERGWQTMAEALAGEALPRWRDEFGVRVWGVWQGLFGVASNELLLLARADAVGSTFEPQHALPGGIDVVDRLDLVATARPRTLRPLGEAGLYVFRFFDVSPRHVEEVVRLSRQAWETFERTDRYAARPEALFREADQSRDPGRMLLLTWYDGFASWETSRAPAPEARSNFLRRHELTAGTVALATRRLPDLCTVA